MTIHKQISDCVKNPPLKPSKISRISSYGKMSQFNFYRKDSNEFQLKVIIPLHCSLILKNALRDIFQNISSSMARNTEMLNNFSNSRKFLFHKIQTLLSFIYLLSTYFQQRHFLPNDMKVVYLLKSRAKYIVSFFNFTP